MSLDNMEDTAKVMIKNMHADSSNLDIEFTDIDEVTNLDEGSPTLTVNSGGQKGPGRQRSNTINMNSAQNKNLRKAMLAL